jgi:hypothetical protein
MMIVLAFAAKWPLHPRPLGHRTRGHLAIASSRPVGWRTLGHLAIAPAADRRFVRGQLAPDRRPVGWRMLGQLGPLSWFCRRETLRRGSLSHIQTGLAMRRKPQQSAR